MLDWQQSRANWHHHENLLGLELANDDATAIFYGFLQCSSKESRCAAWYPMTLSSETSYVRAPK
jgi:hypothetical protein